MWLRDQANAVRDTWEHLSHKEIVGILFYAASGFDDFEIDRYTSGRVFLGISLAQEDSPDDIAVRKLAEAMEARNIEGNPLGKMSIGVGSWPDVTG